MAARHFFEDSVLVLWCQPQSITQFSIVEGPRLPSPDVETWSISRAILPPEPNWLPQSSSMPIAGPMQVLSLLSSAKRSSGVTGSLCGTTPPRLLLRFFLPS
jgi:hypothetical protein